MANGVRYYKNINKMVAIQTKYLGATDTRGSRIKAWTANGQSITISYDYSLDGMEIFKKAALELCKKMNWSECIEGGSTKDGYIFVFVKPVKDILREIIQRAEELSVANNYKNSTFSDNGYYAAINEMYTSTKYN